MEFKELQQKVIKNAFAYGKKHDIKIDQEFSTVKLFEEVGEFAQAFLVYKNKCRSKKRLPKNISHQELAKEIADIFGMVIVNAHLLDIDLEKAIYKKWIDKK